MSKLGTKNKPATVRVQTEEKALELLALGKQKGWEVIVGIEPDKSEDISDLEKLMKPSVSKLIPAVISRNAPCPCGSGKQYKRCVENNKTGMKQKAILYSEVIQDFLSPYLNQNNSIEYISSVLYFGCTAWNYCIFEEFGLPGLPKMRIAIADAHKLHPYLAPLFENMKERKKKKFKSYKHVISKNEVRCKPDGTYTIYVEHFPIRNSV